MSDSWSFSRIFQQVYEERVTGVLSVQTAARSLQLHFADGAIVDLVCTPEDTSRFTEFLVASEALTPKALEKLVRKAERSGRGIDDYLIASKRFTEDVLARYLELHLRETILELMTMTGVRCELRTDAPQRNLWVSPQPVPWFLKQAKLRQAAWPGLRQRIASDALVFEKDPQHISTVLGQGVVSVGTTQGAAPAASEEARVHFGAAERSVFYFANGRKTVTQIGFAAGLSEFETYRALVTMFDAGYLKVTENTGRGEQRRFNARWLSYGLRVFALGLVLYGGGVLYPLLPDPLEHVRRIRLGRDAYVSAARATNAEVVRSRRLEVFYVRNGRPPRSDSELEHLTQP